LRATIASVRHLALAVSDQARSRRFYETYFGFVAEPAPREDGVLILHDAAGFSLALGEVDGAIVLPPFFHFGTGLPSPEDVRAFRDRVTADGLDIVDWWDELDYVSVKFRDPDGYVLEVGWEPR
jgi:catechol 2,3-dioxygenase-like lactoylglutathione lyase family enzyme